MKLDKRQIGTLILAIQNSFNNREKIKCEAKKTGIEHLNYIDEEYKLLMLLSSHYESYEKK